MAEPKLSLFPSEGPPVVAPVPEARTPAPIKPAPTAPDEDTHGRRILAIAVADAAEVVRDLALVLNSPNTEHARAKVGLCVVATERVKHRLRWLLEGKMPDTAAEEAATAAAFAERDRFREALEEVLRVGARTVGTGDPELGPVRTLTPEAQIAETALHTQKRKEAGK